MNGRSWKDSVLRILEHVIAYLIAHAIWILWIFPQLGGH